MFCENKTFHLSPSLQLGPLLFPSIPVEPPAIRHSVAALLRDIYGAHPRRKCVSARRGGGGALTSHPLDGEFVLAAMSGIKSGGYFGRGRALSIEAGDW